MQRKQKFWLQLCFISVWKQQEGDNTVCVCAELLQNCIHGFAFLTPLMTTEGFPHTCPFCSISTPNPTGCSLCTRGPLAAPSERPQLWDSESCSRARSRPWIHGSPPAPCPELDPAGHGPGLSLPRAPPALPGARRAQGSGAAPAPITPRHPIAPRLWQLHLPVPPLQEASHKFLAHQSLGLFVTGAGRPGRR